MVRHYLKIWPEFFAAIWNGTKTFDLRNDDRNFALGDILVLREYDPQVMLYTGEEIIKKVNYILRHDPHAGCAATHGLRKGYVILGIIDAPSFPATESRDNG